MRIFYIVCLQLGLVLYLYYVALRGNLHRLQRLIRTLPEARRPDAPLWVAGPSHFRLCAPCVDAVLGYPDAGPCVGER